MNDDLQTLINLARNAPLASDREFEAQRRSFAFGNTQLENSLITRETVDREAANLRADGCHGTN